MNARATLRHAVATLATAWVTTSAIAQVTPPSPPTRFPTGAAQAPVTALDPTALQQVQAEVTGTYRESQRPSVTLRIPLQFNDFDPAAFPPEAGVRSDQDVLLSCRLTLRHPDDPQQFHMFVLTSGVADALAMRDAEGMYATTWYLDDPSIRDFVARGLRPDEYACKLAPSSLDQEQHQLWSTDATLCDWNVQGPGTRCLASGQFADP